MSHTKFSMIYNRVHWNPNDTPNLSSLLSSRFKSANPLILASNIQYGYNHIIDEQEVYMILPSEICIIIIIT